MAEAEIDAGIDRSGDCVEHQQFDFATAGIFSHPVRKLIGPRINTNKTGFFTATVHSCRHSSGDAGMAALKGALKGRSTFGVGKATSWTLLRPPVLSRRRRFS